MADRYSRQSRIFSQFGKPTMIAGRIELQAPTKAFKVTQGLTLTAAKYGVLQQAITIAFTAGATAGAEVVTVTGQAISVQVESGVSTVTQVRTAMQLVAACTALVTTTGTSSATVAAATALPLAGAVEAVKAYSMSYVKSILQDTSTAGTYVLTLEDSYASCIAAQMTLEATTAVDLVAQLKSADVTTNKQIIFRLNAGATATDPSAQAFVHFAAFLNSSSLN